MNDSLIKAESMRLIQELGEQEALRRVLTRRFDNTRMFHHMLVYAYRAGRSTSELAEMVGMTPQGMNTRLRRLGVLIRPKHVPVPSPKGRGKHA